MPKKKRPHIRTEWPVVQKVVVRGEARFKVDGRPHKERKFFRARNEAHIQADVWARERENQGVEALEFPTALPMEATESRAAPPALWKNADGCGPALHELFEGRRAEEIRAERTKLR